jgi:DNA-binding CsgD family transcriptional regulator
MTRTPVTDPDDLDDIDEDGSNARQMMMSPEEVIEIRRMEVIRRRLRGQTAGAIARALSVSENTIYNDIKAIRESNSKHITTFVQEDFIGDTLQTFQRIEQEAWDQVSQLDDGDARKAKFLDSVRASRKEQIKLLQNSGLLHKEARKVEVQVTSDVLNTWSDDQKQMVADAVVGAAILDAEEILELPEYNSMPKEEEEVRFEDVAEFLDD